MTRKRSLSRPSTAFSHIVPSEQVPPAPHHHLPEDARRVVRLLERERSSLLGVTEVGDVHASGRRQPVFVQRRPAGDHPLGKGVHERPVPLAQLLAQGSRFGVLTVVAAVDEVLHLHVLPIRALA